MVCLVKKSYKCIFNTYSITALRHCFMCRIYPVGYWKRRMDRKTDKCLHKYANGCTILYSCIKMQSIIIIFCHQSQIVTFNFVSEVSFLMVQLNYFAYFFSETWRGCEGFCMNYYCVIVSFSFPSKPWHGSLHSKQNWLKALTQTGKVLIFL